jgi:hypothetical protein
MKILLVPFLTAVFMILGANAHALPTQPIDLGDTTVEQVQIGYSGDATLENLEYWFAQHGITNPDGSAIHPDGDQLQYELFYTDMAREYQVRFLGIGYAGYHSPFGVFTYGGDPFESFDSTLLRFEDPLFVQNEIAPDTDYEFSIDANTYFGFYLNSNNKGKYLTTMIAPNPDGLDHALFYETNLGFTIAFEDILGGGDRDFEDLVVNFNPNPVPEPGTILLLGLGLIGLAGFRRKSRVVQ